ncbi:hypothetical protein [Clostridium sp. Marseille-Q2269]|uniref:hypothetical protein n=1 Tax=Clostridium sp. Marseille-Q2269 TaxID=2942205 RepID=UPI0020737A39|nr:hypothetical protein [Clostridium sp. Marseille-Q2269]
MKKSLIILLIMLICLAYPLTSYSNTSKYSSSSTVSAANNNFYSIPTNTSFQPKSKCSHDILSFITKINMRIYNILHSGVDNTKLKVNVSKNRTQLNKERSALFQVREFFFLEK